MTLIESPQRERRHPIRADVRLSSADGEMPAEVAMIDLSCHGMGTDGLIHFVPDSIVRVEFPNGAIRTGTAMWHDSFWSGIRFDSPLDPAEPDRLMTTLERAPHFSRRAA
ncbi:MAG TPA: hypothetical protein VF463_20825 [Sphingobium sp.]